MQRNTVIPASSVQPIFARLTISKTELDAAVRLCLLIRNQTPAAVAVAAAAAAAAAAAM